MSMEGHLAELARRHQAIEKQIESERARPAMDLARMTELKRKKLLLKDEISKLRH